MDTSSLDLKKLSNVKVGNKEAAGKAAEEAAREKMKRVANDQAKKARRKRAKTQQAAAAVAAKQEEEAEVKAAAEIAMEHSDSTKASKAESPAQIEAKFTRDSAPGLLGWLRPRLLTRWLPLVEDCLHSGGLSPAEGVGGVIPRRPCIRGGMITPLSFLF